MINNSNYSFKVFIDFDGTITKEDVGANIFLRFGRQPEVFEIVDKIRNREISNSEGWRQLFASLPYVDTNELIDFVNGFEIDAAFKSFLSFLNENKVDHYILSDGFDFYIDRIMEREQLNSISVFSNKLIIGDQGELIPVFPYKDEECFNCANCKRNHLINLSADEEFTIYIGDGTSDICPAQHADFIFAKSTLLKFCEQERISFSPFFGFEDVTKKMKEIFSKKRLKKRHQAELKRRAVYMMG
ncbi:MAG: MtnX-like HAD-IB family phosphatase [Ignavibacteriaceae bacterium]|nr:MtnX-like HAD-IB family phosphatase [Ignavibacteriaceae bacterium]